MFPSVEAAREAIGAMMPDHFTDLVMGVAYAALVMQPVEGGMAKGASHFGGTPNMNPAIAWPVRAPVSSPPENVAAIANENGIDLVVAQPLPFLAQIDLAEAAREGALPDDLPREGRLLVFYDLILGPSRLPQDAGRLVYDASPVSPPARAIPPGLQAASDAARAAFEAQRPAMEEMFRDMGLGPYDEAFVDSFILGRRPARLTEMLVLPDPYAQRSLLTDEFRVAFDAPDDNEEGLAFHYEELMYEVGSALQLTLVGGEPVPVQSDPRIDAAVAIDLEEPFLSSDTPAEVIARMEERAADFVQVAQIDLATLFEAPTEGTVYVLMDKDALSAGAFTEALFVYQQT